MVYIQLKDVSILLRNDSYMNPRIRLSQPFSMFLCGLLDYLSGHFIFINCTQRVILINFLALLEHKHLQKANLYCH